MRFLRCAGLVAFAFVLSLVAAPRGAAHAARLGIGGDRVVLEQRARGRRFVFVATGEPALATAHDPVAEGTDVVVLGRGAGGGRTPLLRLDPARWTVRGRAGKQRWRWRDPRGATGGLVEVRYRPGGRHGGTLSVTARGEAWPLVPTGPLDALAVQMRIGADRYCAEFGGSVRRNTAGAFRALHAPTPAGGCPASTCGNGVIEAGEACDDGNLDDGDGCTAACTTSACSGELAPGCDEESIDAAALNPAASSAFGDHVLVSNTRQPALPWLYVMLGDADTTPGDYVDLLRTIALRGVRTVGLAYSNHREVTDICAPSNEPADPDPDCQERVGMERLFGEDVSPRVATGRANAVVNRLTLLLQNLAATRPDAGWEAFLEGTGPRWSSIVVAGHGLGGGEAAMLAHWTALARVVLYGAPADYDQTQPVDAAAGAFTPAGWLLDRLLDPGATPLERYWGFRHLDDQTPFAALIPDNWSLLGLPGDDVAVESGPPPWDGAHRLSTAAAASDPHAALVTGAFAGVHAALCCGP